MALTGPAAELGMTIGVNAFVFCVHYLFLIGRVYVFYGGHLDKIMKPFSML
jgi:hypothetical protein